MGYRFSLRIKKERHMQRCPIQHLGPTKRMEAPRTQRAALKERPGAILLDQLEVALTDLVALERYVSAQPRLAIGETHP